MSFEFSFDESALDVYDISAPYVSAVDMYWVSCASFYLPPVSHMADKEGLQFGVL